MVPHKQNNLLDYETMKVRKESHRR